MPLFQSRPRGSFPSPNDAIRTRRGFFPSDASVASFASSVVSSPTTHQNDDDWDAPSRPRRRTKPSCSMGTKVKLLKLCFKRKLDPSGNFCPSSTSSLASTGGNLSVFSSPVSISSSHSNNNISYSNEWATLMGLPSREEDEMPLLLMSDFMDQDHQY